VKETLQELAMEDILSTALLRQVQVIG